VPTQTPARRLAAQLARTEEAAKRALVQTDPTAKGGAAQKLLDAERAVFKMRDENAELRSKLARLVWGDRCGRPLSNHCAQLRCMTTMQSCAASWPGWLGAHDCEQPICATRACSCAASWRCGWGAAGPCVHHIG